MVSIVGDTWIEIAWDPPEGRGTPPLSHYVISVSEESHAHAEGDGDLSLLLRSFSSDDTSVVIPGLLPGTAHTVAVATVTRLTTGDRLSNYSADVAIATLPATGR